MRATEYSRPRSPSPPNSVRRFLLSSCATYTLRVMEHDPDTPSAATRMKRGALGTRPRLAYDPAFGLIVLALGVAIIALIGNLERSGGKEETWADALLAPDGEPLWEGSLPVLATRIPMENFPEYEQAMEGFADSSLASALEQTEYPLRERCVVMNLSQEQIGALLAWGRPPVSGSNEVLAGVWTRFKEFELNGETYEVVGGLRRDAGALYFSYLIPGDPDGYEWSEAVDEGWTLGWYHPHGRRLFEEMGKEDAESLRDMAIVGGQTPAQTQHAWSVIAGLVFVVMGGAFAQTQLFVFLSKRRCGPFSPIFRAVRERPYTFALCHGLLYGVFFCAMVAAPFFPVEFLWAGQLVRLAFESDPLSKVADAYAAKNIPLAALVTFKHNFFLGTAASVILPSLFIPFAGLLINLVRFSILGFAMAPLWSGTASGYVFHSITFTLELEAYVVAVFAICLWPRSILRAFRSTEPRVELRSGMGALLSGTLLVSIILAVAATYEAITLITFRSGI